MYIGIHINQLNLVELLHRYYEGITCTLGIVSIKRYLYV